MTVMSGKEVSEKIREDIRNEVAEISQKYDVKPGLAVIQVGQDAASSVYVRNKKKTCVDLGMHSVVIYLNENITTENVIKIIDELNEDNVIHGILVQLPLPKHLDEELIISRISPEKDVDVFHNSNLGLLFKGIQKIAPCTPSGIMEMLKYYNIDVVGKHCVVVGRSNIVGKPMASLMLQKNATVTVCHSKTSNLKDICRLADILVVAVGRAGFITKDMVKENAVVIDVGINRDENGKLHGDVSEDVSEIAGYMTPVPGGVGPMTITMLMKNTLELMKLKELNK